jgi:hypothetical protein
VLAFDYGLNPDRWIGLEGGPFTFKIGARTRDGAEAKVSFEGRVDPARQVVDRRWMPGKVDLSAYAGMPIELDLSIDATRAPATAPGLAGWLEPRFVARATSADAASGRCSGMP